jgi:hypothetical protein
MTALGIFVRLETKSGNPHGYDGSMRVKAAKQHSQNLCACRQHGNWPGFWQLAPVHGCPFCMTCYSQSDSSSALSHFLNFPRRRKDWHSRCTSVCRGNVCNAVGTSHHRLFLLAMVTLLAAAFGFNPAVRAQDTPIASGVQVLAQSIGNHST